jgi:FkbM family methyltransferase
VDAFDPSRRDPYFLRHLVTASLQGWLLHALREKRQGDVFFLQVGANDGRTHDPLHNAIRQHHWRGILVEPVPTMFEALQANYAGVPGLAFEQVACADRPGVLPFFRIRNHEQHAWDGVRGLSSLNRDIIRPHFASDEEFARFVEEVPVQIVTAEDLLARHGVARVDLVLIDTEGADARVLDGFAVERWRPEILMMEHLHLSPEDRARVNHRMHALGYLRCVGVMDTFYYQPSLCSMDELDTLAMFQNTFLSLR